MKLKVSLVFATVALSCVSGPAFGYIGPGAGLSALGAVLGLLLTIVMAVGVIVSWPVRHLMRRTKRRSATPPKELDTVVTGAPESMTRVDGQR